MDILEKIDNHLNNNEINEVRLRIGDKVKISANSGVDGGKTAKVVDKSKIKTDSKGIPVNTNTNHYSPVDWKKEVAIEYENGELSTMYKDRLTKI